MGVDLEFGELDLKVLGGEPSFIRPDGYPTTHGTKVAGVITAATNNEEGIPGLAPRAIILPMKMKVTALTSGGVPIMEFSSGVKAIRSLRFECGEGKWGFNAPVVNCSFSNNGTPWGVPRELAQGYNIKRDVKVNNRLYVAGSGNDGQNVKKYPAAYERVLGVSGINAILENDESQGMHYDIIGSQYGAGQSGGSNYFSADLEVYPVSGIYACKDAIGNTRGFSTATYPHVEYGFYSSFSGTSSAAPCVTALAFLLFDANPTADWDEVYDRIVDTRNDSYAVANPPLAGLVDFEEALDGWN